MPAVTPVLDVLELLTLVIVVGYLLVSAAWLAWRGRFAAALYRLAVTLLLLLAPYLVYRCWRVDWAKLLMLPGVVLLLMPIFLERRRSSREGGAPSSGGSS